MASCFLGALAFMDQVNMMTTKTLPMSQLLQWLNSAHGPSLVEAGREHDRRSALALVLTPECLYDPDSSRVRLALVYKPIYVKTVSFGEAYFHLRTAVEAASGKIIDPLIMFVLLSGSSEVIPLPNDHPLFLDVSSPSYIEETGLHRGSSALEASNFTGPFACTQVNLSAMWPTLSWKVGESHTTCYPRGRKLLQRF